MKKILKKQEETLDNCVKLSLYTLTITLLMVFIIGVLSFICDDQLLIGHEEEIKHSPKWEMYYR